MAIVSCINSVLTCSRDCHVFSGFPRIMSHGVFLLLCDHFQNHPNRLFLCSHKRPLINSVLTCSRDCHVFSGFPRIMSRGVFFSLFERISVNWVGRKESLYISKIAKFESDFFKTNENISPHSRVILQTFLQVGSNLPPPPPLPPYKCLQIFAALWSYIFSLTYKTYHSQTWQFYSL